MPLLDRPLPLHLHFLLVLLLLYGVGLGSANAALGATEGGTGANNRLKKEGPKPDFNGKFQSEESINNWKINSSRAAVFPCPVATAIAPCICTLNETVIDLDCTKVGSEEQLANVFQQEFPVKELHEFFMANNSAIRVLRNILNGVTFERISLYPGPFILEQISDYLFLGIANTLKSLDIRNSKLTSDDFPFAILSQMTELEEIHLDGSLITWIPPVTAPKLSFLDIRHGLTETVEAGTFPIHGWATALYLSSNPIHFFEPGSFFFVDENSAASNSSLIIHLMGNQLQSLRAGTIPLRNGHVELFMPASSIASIEPGTFVIPPGNSSLELQLWLYDNELTTIDEVVFGDLMPHISYLSLQGNPLSCGCDIAWLVTNPDHMAVIADAPACAESGTLLSDLDLQYYLEFCSSEDRDRNDW